MAENRYLSGKSEAMTKREDRPLRQPAQAANNFWNNMTPDGRDAVAVLGVGGALLCIYQGIKKGYVSDLQIGGFFRWLLKPHDRSDKD